ncbi:MAG: SMI1/KNR4 family protein [Oscillospiraceae bacterium]|nr:SMI1/KNR4 family protein [Oscillospiraceae bacterium]
MEKRIEIIKGIVDDWMSSEFGAPVTDAMIDEFERKMDIVIPASYRDFLNQETVRKKTFGEMTTLWPAQKEKGTAQQGRGLL